ncbi:MAG: Serine/threonine-protein kinase PknK [Planctomycetes bacterium]|nr:Serine/threonine-protein kinase PknK [Planctomycetota bacterium]
MYLRQKFIQRGGCGEVWQATREGTADLFAVKMLINKGDPHQRHLFAREVRSLQGYNHPHIMKVAEANTECAEPFYAMPYMERGMLTQYAGRLSLDGIRLFLSDFADVLAYLHINNAVHRDIKPDNILVDRAGQWYLSDFGLGNDPRFTKSRSMNNGGTEGFCARELYAQGSNATTESDMYSFGATLFYMVTGVNPADIGNQGGQLDIWWYAKGYAADVRNFVMNATNPDPARRPTANRVLAELGRPQRVADAEKTANNPWPGILTGAACVGLLFLAIKAFAGKAK